MFQHPGLLFVLASIIAVLGIAVSFRQLIGAVQEKLARQQTAEMSSFQQENSRFFLKVGLVEVIPIVLIVIGFTMLEQHAGTLDMSEVLLALIIVLAVSGFGILNIFMSRQQAVSQANLSEQGRGFLTSLTLIGIGLATAIPVIAIIALIILVG